MDVLRTSRSAGPRPVLRLAAVVVALLASGLAAAVATVAAAPPASALTPTRTVGGGPLDDVMHWAGQYARPNDACGLTQHRLAAMMLAVTFSETGASAATAPSPMTLSRWDTQAALWAFGNPATKYQQAFFHPGVGQWQFDSAGGWPITAAGAIDTKVSGKLAAQTMANGYCGSASADIPTKMRAGWRPWTYCTSVTNPLCFDLFNSIFDGTRVVVKRDNAVTSTGGMELRTCTIGGVGKVTCGFVDPDKAQGARNFTAVPRNNVPPTPITKPFYVFEANGREYRYWLRQDTGYDATVVASKPLTANARTSLQWTTVEAGAGALCDEATRKGCALPFGSVDQVTAALGTVTVRGWAVDPHTTAPTRIQIRIDGVQVRDVPADAPRPDVQAAVPGTGPNHGFHVTIPNVGGGGHSVCVTALDTAAPIIGHAALGCQDVTMPGGDPTGTMDDVIGRARSVRVRGWALDPDTTAATSVHVYVEGIGVAATADKPRPDVGAVFPAHGPNHGYDVTVPNVPPGDRTACTYAINAGAGTNRLLGCRAVRVLDVNPFGVLDVAEPGEAQSLRVTGWSLDPDTDGPTEVHVYANGIGVATKADRNRADVAAHFTGYAPTRGFDVTMKNLPAGPTTVCAYAINIGAGSNALLGCRQVEIVDRPPVGTVDLFEAKPGAVRLVGWAFDPDTSAAIDVQVSVNGVARVAVPTKIPRPDVAAAFDVGPNRGFEATVLSVPKGRHTICATAINVGSKPNPSIGCKTLDVP